MSDLDRSSAADIVLDQLAQHVADAGQAQIDGTRPADGAVLRFAIVTAVGSGVNAGQVRTDATGTAWVPCGESYAPTVADKVAFIQQGPTVLVVDAVRTTTAPLPVFATDLATAISNLQTTLTAAKPHNSRYLTATVNVPDSTWTDIPFDVSLNVVGSLVWNGSLNQFEIPVGGQYLVNAGCRWNSPTAYTRNLRIMFNGTVRAYNNQPAGDGGDNKASRVHRLTTAGQAIKVQCFQDSGTTQSLFVGGNPWCYADVTWLGETS